MVRACACAIRSKPYNRTNESTNRSFDGYLTWSDLVGEGTYATAPSKSALDPNRVCATQERRAPGLFTTPRINADEVQCMPVITSSEVDLAQMGWVSPLFLYCTSLSCRGRTCGAVLSSRTLQARSRSVGSSAASQTGPQRTSGASFADVCRTDQINKPRRATQFGFAQTLWVVWSSVVQPRASSPDFDKTPQDRRLAALLFRAPYKCHTNVR